MASFYSETGSGQLIKKDGLLTLMNSRLSFVPEFSYRESLCQFLEHSAPGPGQVSPRFPFPSLLGRQPRLPPSSRDPGPNWALAWPSRKGCWQRSVRRRLARGRAGDGVQRDCSKGLNPEAGRGWTRSQVATWSVAPRPAQAPPRPAPRTMAPPPSS